MDIIRENEDKIIKIRIWNEREKEDGFLDISEDLSGDIMGDYWDWFYLWTKILLLPKSSTNSNGGKKKSPSGIKERITKTKN